MLLPFLQYLIACLAYSYHACSHPLPFPWPAYQPNDCGLSVLSHIMRIKHTTCRSSCLCFSLCRFLLSTPLCGLFGFVSLRLHFSPLPLFLSPSLPHSPPIPPLSPSPQPCHYHVLIDDSRSPVDDLQQLTFSLCHVYARCLRSVSMPAPLYYSHLASYRARLYTGLEDDAFSVQSGGHERGWAGGR